MRIDWWRISYSFRINSSLLGETSFLSPSLPLSLSLSFFFGQFCFFGLLGGLTEHVFLALEVEHYLEAGGKGLVLGVLVGFVYFGFLQHYLVVLYVSCVYPKVKHLFLFSKNVSQQQQQQTIITHTQRLKML